MTLSTADQVWNRAALESGGLTPHSGDTALAALLRAHGIAMNGGVHHVIDVLTAVELAAAADGFSYFGLQDVAAFLNGAATDPVLSQWTDETEHVANERYAELVPSDSFLTERFERVFYERPNEFAPIRHGAS